MDVFKKQIGVVMVFILLGMAFAAIASAKPVRMNFDGALANGGANDQVATYYDGGCTTFLGGNDICNGPNDGVVWSGAQISNVTSSASGMLSPPSLPNYIILTNNNAGVLSATMDVAAGFDTGLAFFYYGSPMVAVYSGLNGTGTLLNPDSAMLDLNTCGSLGFCAHGLGFSGTAMSVVFSGNGIFDNVAVGTTKVPEPAALGMFGLGFLLISGFVGLRRRAA